MASFPGAKVHRVSRRKLGRGQHAAAPPVTITMSSSTSTVTLTFSVPVVVSGTIPMTSAAGSFVSQAILSSTQVSQVWSTTQTSVSKAIVAGVPQILSYQGGVNAAVTSTG